MLARSGRKVRVLERERVLGGCIRTDELTLPGFRHDVCSAVHPFGAASPFLRSLPLERHGLTWLHPELELAKVRLLQFITRPGAAGDAS